MKAARIAALRATRNAWWRSRASALCVLTKSTTAKGLEFKAIINMSCEPSATDAGRFSGKRRTDAMISTAFGFYFGRAADGLNNFSPFI